MGVQDGGTGWRPAGQPEPVKVHDFLHTTAGEANPYDCSHREAARPEPSLGRECGRGGSPLGSEAPRGEALAAVGRGNGLDRKPFSFLSWSGVELVFRALADPTRRALLDALFERDGQTLVALTARRDMTRIAVAKHLRLLEEAGLVVSRRRGREKFHYLNTVPIRLIHDRWVSKYTEPWAAGLAGLKTELEHPMEKVFEIYIRTTPERLWEAITDPAIRAKYQFGAGIESDWTPGSRYALKHPSSEGLLAEGENLLVDPPRRLVQSMHILWSEAAEREGTSRVSWQIEPVGDSCRLIVTHDQLSDSAPPELYGGWPMILSGLKTWLETGQTLTTPGSLMYGQP